MKIEAISRIRAVRSVESYAAEHLSPALRVEHEPESTESEHMPAFVVGTETPLSNHSLESARARELLEQLTNRR